MRQGSIQQPQPYPPQDPFDEDIISLIDILSVLKRHLILIIIVPTIFSILMIIYVLFFAQPMYISTTTFMSSGSRGAQTQMMGLASQFGFAMPNTSSGPQWSYEEVIKSRTMAKTLLKHRFDTKEYGPHKELLQILTYGNKEPEFEIDTLIKTGIDAVQEMIEISMSGRMFELEVSAFEPQLAAGLANGIIEELDRHQRDYNARKTTETRQFIEERMVDTKTELEMAEETLKEFRERNRSILESPQLQLEQERFGRDVAVLIGVFTTLKQQLETAKIDEVKESDYVIILDEPETPLYPAKPNKILMVILAGSLGIVMGIVFAFIREYIGKSDEE